MSLLNFVGCANQVRSLSSTSRQKNSDSHIPHPGEAERVLKKSSLQDECSEDEESKAPVLKDKNKIKSLQTSIHKNLLRLFHKLKSAKPGSVIPDRKEFTNFAAQSNPDSNNPGVSTGVPLSKVRDGIKNASQFQDLNTTTTLKAIDKLVSVVLPNSTAGGNNSSSRDTDSEGGSGSAMDPTDLSKGKTDPYAAIAAGPDHPKLPPDLKISPGGAEGEAPPVVPVGMSDDSKAGPESDEGPHPQSPDGEKRSKRTFYVCLLSSLAKKTFLLLKKVNAMNLIAVVSTISIVMESTLPEVRITLSLLSKCSYREPFKLYSK